jgi:phosphatidylserine/phosphatidylglycerophosphate/cardiolipin synthase-like enzyme
MHDLQSITLVDDGVRGEVELIVDAQHLHRVVYQGILQARASLEIATADFKAMLVPPGGVAFSRTAPSIVQWLVKLADRGVEVRLLHAGVPSGPALEQLKANRSANLTIRRCPRLHAKAVIVDSAAMYLGSANLTGAGLGAKGQERRNFEMGVWTQATPLIDAVLGQFNSLWEGQRCRTCKRHDICPVPLEEPRL